MSMPVVQPHSVWSQEIVANVNVRKPVAIYVADLHGQSEIQRGRHRLALLVGKELLPSDRREVALSVVEIKHVWLARFNQMAVFNLKPGGIAPAHDRLSVN